MKYKGIELEEVTEVQLFDPPKEMLLWDNKSNSPTKDKVLAILTITLKPMTRNIARLPTC